METTQPFPCPNCGAPIAAGQQPGLCPQCGQAIATLVPEGDPGADRAGRAALADDEALTVISDTVVGPNLRMKDNLYQAIAIGACLLIGAAVGAVIGFFSGSEERGLAVAGGAVLGGLLGVVLGLLGSGAFLAVYRLIRHIRGHHD